MKTVAAASLFALLLAHPALAQANPPPPPEPPAMDHPNGDMPHPTGPSKSARFRLQVGHIYLGMTCPDDEPMKSCADMAMQLLDKAESISHH